MFNERTHNIPKQKIKKGISLKTFNYNDNLFYIVSIKEGKKSPYEEFKN